jgi:AraC-like DNA-binding protein
LLYCFNNILKIKFTDLRTNLRIDYAKEILINGEAEKLSMDGISNKAGFSSRSTFYTAFKSVTGSTPKEFILNLKSRQTSWVKELLVILVYIS